MASRHGMEFRREAVRLALTSGLIPDARDRVSTTHTIDPTRTFTFLLLFDQLDFTNAPCLVEERFERAV
jgi:hypothetical protein